MDSSNYLGNLYLLKLEKFRCDKCSNFMRHYNTFHPCLHNICTECLDLVQPYMARCPLCDNKQIQIKLKPRDELVTEDSEITNAGYKHVVSLNSENSSQTMAQQIQRNNNKDFAYKDTQRTGVLMTESQKLRQKGYVEHYPHNRNAVVESSSGYGNSYKSTGHQRFSLGAEGTQQFRQRTNTESKQGNVNGGSKVKELAPMNNNTTLSPRAHKSLCNECHIMVASSDCTQCKYELCVNCYSLHCCIKAKMRQKRQESLSKQGYCSKHRGLLKDRICRDCMVDICPMCAIHLHKSHSIMPMEQQPSTDDKPYKRTRSLASLSFLAPDLDKMAYNFTQDYRNKATSLSNLLDDRNYEDDESKISEFSNSSLVQNNHQVSTQQPESNNQQSSSNRPLWNTLPENNHPAVRSHKGVKHVNCSNNSVDNKPVSTNHYGNHYQVTTNHSTNNQSHPSNHSGDNWPVTTNCYSDNPQVTSNHYGENQLSAGDMPPTATTLSSDTPYTFGVTDESIHDNNIKEIEEAMRSLSKNHMELLESIKAEKEKIEAVFEKRIHHEYMKLTSQLKSHIDEQLKTLQQQKDTVKPSDKSGFGYVSAARANGSTGMEGKVVSKQLYKFKPMHYEQVLNDQPKILGNLVKESHHENIDFNQTNYCFRFTSTNFLEMSHFEFRNSVVLFHRAKRMCLFQNRIWIPCWDVNAILVHSLYSDFHHKIVINNIQCARSLHPLNHDELILATNNGLLILNKKGIVITTIIKDRDFHDVSVDGSNMAAITGSEIFIWDISDLNTVQTHFNINHEDPLRKLNILLHDNHIYIGMNSTLNKFTMDGELIRPNSIERSDSFTFRNHYIPCTIDNTHNVIVVNTLDNYLKVYHGMADRGQPRSQLTYLDIEEPVDAMVCGKTLYILNKQGCTLSLYDIYRKNQS